MNPSQVTYARRQDCGAMQTEEIRVTIELQPGDTAHEALKRAKKFVLHAMENGPDPELQKAQAILENPDEHLGSDVKWAKKYIADLPPVDDTPIL